MNSSNTTETNLVRGPKGVVLTTGNSVSREYGLKTGGSPALAPNRWIYPVDRGRGTNKMAEEKQKLLKD